MSGDFLSRWSRRKRGAVAAPKAAENQEPPPETGGPAPGVETTAPIEDAIPQLPSLEELTAESDVAAFLRAGVPAPLRNAALRRIWSLDPAIRDFVGDARDYAWDWNVPGGVPGTGPLSAEEASGAVREMWRRIGGDPAHAVEPAAPADASERGETAPGPPPVAEVDPAPSTEPALPADAGVASAATPAATPDPSVTGPGAVAATPMRRHGRARPV